MGVNSAGKSTIINILCGQLAKDGGTVRIGGGDLDEAPDRIQRSLGVVFPNSVLDKDLSVRDNLKSRAALYGILGREFRERLEELSELLNLESLPKRPVGDLRKTERMTVFLTTHYMEEAADADYVVILDSGKIAAEGTPWP